MVRTAGLASQNHGVFVEPRAQPLCHGLRLFAAAYGQLAGQVARGGVFGFGVAPEDQIHAVSCFLSGAKDATLCCTTVAWVGA
jgi:hypothetical protein